MDGREREAWNDGALSSFLCHITSSNTICQVQNVSLTFDYSIRCTKGENNYSFEETKDLVLTSQGAVHGLNIEH